MEYRRLGKTGLMVSEIGFGAEWMEKKSAAEVRAVTARCEEAGINILDCWMAGPDVRSNLGAALADTRDSWIIQGTSAPPGRTGSTCARATWTSCAPPSKTCSRASAPTTWSSA
ncbi:hypothetical protein [Eggerthella sinensis]|uniref:hypothetical protein n=1 Tax=Eggerthella sinensis TaxID=242230 RepID=UPI0022E484BF|nr:hypothetical protein [Eggerthella sinensis]